DGGKAGGFREHAEGVTDVLEQGVHFVFYSLKGDQCSVTENVTRDSRRPLGRENSQALRNEHGGSQALPLRTLFISKSNHWVHFHGASRGNVARRGNYHGDQTRDSGENVHVYGAGAVNETCESARGEHRERHSDDDASASQPCAAARYEPEHVARFGAESHAHAKFVSAFDDGIAHYAIHADERDEQRNEAERAHH